VLTTIETAPGFVCRVARGDAERAGYFALRRAIFCDEQGLFRGDDADDCDRTAVPIVCLATAAAGAAGAGADTDLGARVVGVVRIWEEAPGDFWGGRLGVDAAHRTVGAVGRWLVQAAVGTARAWGAVRFRATVQEANVAFFRRLRWSTLERIELFGRPHHLMEADLARYAPIHEPRPAEVERDAA
jgi:putative N-acetyltransferase (TIGR04045 family)